MDSFSPLALRKMDRVAASRQKSCNACVRGKRKCDKRAPKCTRCAAKGLECVYQKTPPGAAPSSVNLAGQQHQSQNQSPVAASVADVPDFDMGFDIESFGNTTASSSSTTTPDTSNASSRLAADVLQLDSAGLDTAGLDLSIMDLLSGSSNGTSELWDLSLPDHMPGTSKMDIPPVPSAPLVRQPIRDVALLNDPDDCMIFNPLDVHDKRTRIGSIVDYIRTMHAGFATSRALPFIHPRLYGSHVPPAIMHAFSAAAAYAARTEQNTGWVIRLVADAARDVHREGERASSRLEKLARVQALVILDTIRVFDGDLGLRAAAEREATQLIGWTEALNTLESEIATEMGVSGPPSRDCPPKSWDSWILLESTRRTVMMAFSYVCLSAVLKSLEPPCDVFTPSYHFTASRHLWEANSSYSFFRAWHEKPQYLVTNMQFHEFWMYGRPEDVDEFTKLMLTAQVGPEAMEHFMTGVADVKTAAAAAPDFNPLKDQYRQNYS